MPTGLDQEEKEKLYNPEERQSRERFNGAPAPSDDELPSDRLARQIEDAERDAAETNAPGISRPVTEREKEPFKVVLGSGKEAQKKAVARRRQQTKRRILIGLGTGGGIISLLFGLFALGPFKVPGAMDLVVNKVNERIEHIVERRAEKIILSYIINGSNASLGNRNFIATGNWVGDLFANLRISRFEDKLFTNYGINIEPGGDGASVKITHNGKEWGKFKHADELQAFLDRDGLDAKEARRAIKLVTQLEIPAWRVFKRAKFARWLRIVHNVPHWGGPKRQAGETDEQLKARIYQDRVTTLETQDINEGVKVVDCLIKGDCQNLDANTARDIQERLAAGEGIDGIKKELEAGVAEIAKTIATEALQDAEKASATKFISRISTRLATMAGSKLIPIVGWIDLAATLDHAIADLSQDGKLFLMIAKLRAFAYGAFYAYWVGVGDQIKAGDADTVAVDLASNDLNGLEEAVMFHIINSGRAIGVGIAHADRINSNMPFVQAGALFGDIYNSLPTQIAIRGPLIGWYYTVGWLLRQGGDLLGEGILWAMEHTPCGLAKAVNPILLALDMCPKDILDKLTQLFGDVVFLLMRILGGPDALTKGAEAYNGIATGGQTMADAYCETELGCHKVTEAVAREQSRAVVAARAELNRSLPLHERLLSLDNSDSLASNLARSLPTPQPSQGFAQLAFAGSRLVANAPLNFSRAITPRVYAEGETTINQYIGTDPMGLNADEVELPIAPEALNGKVECPTEGASPTCKVDIKLVQAIDCVIITDCPDFSAGAAAPPAPVGNLPSGTAKELAAQILANPKITYEDNFPKDDLRKTAAGETLNWCGANATLNTDLMRIMLAVTQDNGAYKGYSYRVNRLVSSHSCGTWHGKGRAADLGMVNGVQATTQSLGQETYRGFATHLGNLKTILNIPTKLEMAQIQCLGNLPIPSGIDLVYNDACNHIHIGVEER